jgi:glutaredoxin 3
MQKTVKIYSTPTCHFCALAKEFFKENNVQFENLDVSTDLNARTEMVEQSGQMGVPVIIIGDDLIVGFNKPKVAELLDIKI